MKTKFEENEIARVVGDGALAETTMHEGRMIVVLILDCSKHRHLEDVIQLHGKTLPGDVISTWATTDAAPWSFGLCLNFLRPTPCDAMILFEMPKHLFIMDSIVHNHACYIQSSTHGMKFSEAYFTVPRVLLEISAEPSVDWEREVHRRTFERFRNDGLSRAAAKEATKNSIREIREQLVFRKPFRQKPK